MRQISRGTSKLRAACAVATIILAGAATRLQAKEWHVAVGAEGPGPGKPSSGFPAERTLDPDRRQYPL